MKTPPQHFAPPVTALRDPYEQTRHQLHPHCVACGMDHPNGLHQAFTPDPDGGVVGVFPAGPTWQGYPGVLHGGIAALLLDAAMTNCLFAHGLHAVTAELKVRYRESVTVAEPVLVRANLARSHGRFHLLEAALVQSGRPKVTASAKFMNAQP